MYILFTALNTPPYNSEKRISTAIKKEGKLQKCSGGGAGGKAIEIWRRKKAKRENEKLLFVVERATNFAFILIKYALLRAKIQ